MCSAFTGIFSTPGTRARALPQLKPILPVLRWLGLEVRNCVDISSDLSMVEFIARSRLGGRAHRLHETSRFERVNNRWLYVEALTSEGRPG